MSNAAAAKSATAELALAESRVDLRQAIEAIGRALAYVRPFRWRFAVKWILTAIAVTPVLILPWPLKLLTDNVILRQPLTAETVAQYPPYMQGVVGLMTGWAPPEIALGVVLAGVATVLLLGVFGQNVHERNVIGGPGGAYEMNGTRATMSAGTDAATNSENEANSAWSWASGLLGLFDYRWQLRLSQAVNHYFRAELFQRIKTLPVAALEDRRTGDLIYRVMYDTPMITRLLYDLLITPVAIITFILVIYVMTQTYGEAPEIIWLALAVLPVTFLTTSVFSAMSRRRSAIARVTGAHTTSTVDESMTNVFAVQSLGGWARERTRFEAASEASFKGARGQVLAGQLVASAAALAWTALLLVTSFQVASHVISRQFTVGDYGVLVFYYTWMAASTATLSQIWIRSQDNVVGLRRVFALLDIAPESDMGARALPRVSHGVWFDKVSLTYPGGRQALDGVSFEAKVGEITALVGSTGAGKTSLAYLVPRFRQATSGQVLVDGIDVTELRLDDLRRQVAYVFQETTLFSMSVADNIRYGCPDASRERVIEAARTAGADGFIRRLPDGYDTELGAQGAKLSVGQRQRIAIARALVLDTPILILDEPTSALDPETERYLVEAMNAAAKGRCVIVIAHRLSTIAHADKVVVLDGGRLIEQGRPADLLSRPGSAYGRFARLQAADD